jgi:uncharacterized protein (DUF885 family)
MKPRFLSISALSVFLAACAAQTERTGPPAPAAILEAPVAPDAAASERFHAMLDRYFEGYLRLNPLRATYIGDPRYNDQLPNSLGPQYLEERHAFNERYLAEVQTFDPGQLSTEDRISYEVFLRERVREREGERFPEQLLPVNQAGSLLTTMATLASGRSAQPFATTRDYENWLRRLDGFVSWIDQAIANMRLGIARGVVQPRPVMEKVLPQVETMIVDRPEDSLFYAPVTHFPEQVPEADRVRLAGEYQVAIRERVVPAYRRLAQFIRDEYLPRCRTSVAWSALPDGDAWYAYYVREHTTTTLTADEIHEIGLAEVRRILAEMDAVRSGVGFGGDLKGFFAFLENDPQFYFTRGQDLLQGYRDLKVRIDAALPKLFSVFPKADYEVREVEAFRAQAAAGAYYQQPSADGSRPGVFYVNTYNLKAQPKFGMETLSLHEASPGHHFQRTIQQELENLPRFRRFGGSYTAFVEGWALYAEYLGRELGMFTDPYQWFGRLNDEQLRAMRLVVDTGLHAKGWSREQAIEFMLENSTLAPSDVESEVERYIAWPGQALGYKVGDLRIQALRHRAEAELGERFDVRDFHREVLCDGAVPLDVLEAKIDRWIASRRQPALKAGISAGG